MKKIITKIAVLLTAGILIGFSACKLNADGHEHVFNQVEKRTATFFEAGTIILKCKCGETKTENVGPLFSVPSDENGVPLKAIPEDKYVYFGFLPRTVVKQDGSKLYGIDNTTEITIEETTENSITIGSNTYYKGSDGEYYQKVKETLSVYNEIGSKEHEEFKELGEITNDEPLRYSDGTSVRKSNLQAAIPEVYTRWFRVEPIKWKILTTDFALNHDNPANSEKACLLLAEEIINSNVVYSELWKNNYKESQMRAYLNGLGYKAENIDDWNWKNKGFLQTAFISSAQELIKTTKVDNSAETTGYIPEYYSYNFYCDDTEDKIFLLSQKDVINSDYGFPAHDAFGVDNVRIRKATDYAKANNVYESTTPGYGGCWWLRSPIYSVYTCVCGIHHHGLASNCNNIVSNNCGGIVPALAVSISGN